MLGVDSPDFYNEKSHAPRDYKKCKTEVDSRRFRVCRSTSHFWVWDRDFLALAILMPDDMHNPYPAHVRAQGIHVFRKMGSVDDVHALQDYDIFADNNQRDLYLDKRIADDNRDSLCF